MELSGNNSFGLLLLTSPSALSLKYPCQNVLTHNKYVQFYTRHFTAIDVLVSHLCIFKWFMYLYFLKLVFSFLLLYLTHIEWQCHTDNACTIPHHISHLCIWIVLLLNAMMIWRTNLNALFSMHKLHNYTAVAFCLCFRSYCARIYL